METFTKKKGIRFRRNLSDHNDIRHAILDAGDRLNGFRGNSCYNEKSELIIHFTPYWATETYEDLPILEWWAAFFINLIELPFNILGNASLFIIPSPNYTVDIFVLDAEVVDNRDKTISKYTIIEKNSIAIRWLPEMIWKRSEHQKLGITVWNNMAENLYASMADDGFFEEKESQLVIPMYWIDNLTQ